MSKTSEPSVFAVALFPGEGDAVREVRVAVLDLFGAPSLAECIGAAVREVGASGTPFGPWAFLPVQRLVAVRTDETGRRIFSASELAAKKTAYAARLAAGPAPVALPARRKPSLPWMVAHEAETEAA